MGDLTGTRLDSITSIPVNISQILYGVGDIQAETSSIHMKRLTSAADVPITLSWKDVEVWTSNPDAVKLSKLGTPAGPDGGTTEPQGCFCKSEPPKQILQKVSGVARPGELVALMGASGAGKTTLLNFLAFRNQGSLHITGSRYINGFPASSDDIASVSAYIEQEDIFFGALTVREHLEFHANLRIGKGITTEGKREIVNDIMAAFGLMKCADVQIGVPGRIVGISGGEMKRLSLASELIWDPQLLICDEPTTGLDIYMATTIVKELKALTTEMKTIICTIHQPSATIFALFDRVILLADGCVAFQGPIPECLDFFTAQGYPCPPNYNMADHLVHCLAISPNRSPKALEMVYVVCEEYMKSSAYAQLEEMFARNEIERKTNASPPIKARQGYQVSWCTQFKFVFKRSIRCIISDPMVIPLRLLQTIILGIIVGVVFLGKGERTSGMDNERFLVLAGVLYLVVTNLSLQYIYCALDGFQSEIPLFLRDHFNGMYRVDVYFFAKQLADFPFFVLLPILFTLIVHLMVRFPWDGFGKPVLVLYLFSFLVAFCAGSYGYFISAASPNINVALIYAAGMLLPLMLYSGFAVRAKHMRAWNSWLKYLSWFWYADEAMISYQLDDVTIKGCLGERCSAALYLHELFEFKKESLALDIFGIIIIAFFFRILTFVALYRKTVRHN